tara:strand:- start:745 stop:1296 length:552 start_codon:yes stop_codon:yes gene_type:complete
MGSQIDLEPFLKIRTAIQNHDCTHAIYVDAFDVLVSRWEEKEVETLIDKAGGLLMSCECGCWPAGPWCDTYVARKRTPWCAINGGQFAGTRQAMIDLLREVYDRKNMMECGGGNQEILHKMLADGYEMGLDQECRIFQSMAGLSECITEKNGIMYNTFTDTFPMFPHWNGRTPGMGDWLKVLL